jgi:hypothetical protein
MMIFSRFEIENLSIVIATFLFYIEIARKKGRFIPINSSNKWYKLIISFVILDIVVYFCRLIYSLVINYKCNI